MPRRVARRAAAASPPAAAGLRQRNQHVQLEAGVVRAHLAQEGAQPLQRAGDVALGGARARRRHCSRSPRVTGSSSELDQRVIGRPARAHAGPVRRARACHFSTAPHLQRLVQARAHALGQGHALLAQPAGVAPQAQLGEGQRQVAQHQHAAVDIAGAFEGRRRLLQQRQPLGDVAATEAEHVQRIGQAVGVAACRASATACCAARREASLRDSRVCAKAMSQWARPDGPRCRRRLSNSAAARSARWPVRRRAPRRAAGPRPGTARRWPRAAQRRGRHGQGQRLLRHAERALVVAAAASAPRPGA